MGKGIIKDKVVSQIGSEKYDHFPCEWYRSKPSINAVHIPLTHNQNDLLEKLIED